MTSQHFWPTPIQGERQSGNFSYTCIRAGEFCWLTKKDVGLDIAGVPAFIHIRAKTCPETGALWVPKHKMERVVPLSARASEIVKGVLGTKSPWLFSNQDAQTGVATRWMDRSLRLHLLARCKEAGIAKGSLHRFRHTGATLFANDGSMPIVHTQRLLGHQHLDTTMGYLHPEAADIAASIKGVNFGKFEKKPPVEALSATQQPNGA